MKFSNKFRNNFRYLCVFTLKILFQYHKIMSSSSFDHRHLQHLESQSIGVLTSGGDSQGMNAAIRSSVRMGMFLKCRVSD